MCGHDGGEIGSLSQGAIGFSRQRGERQIPKSENLRLSNGVRAGKYNHGSSAPSPAVADKMASSGGQSRGPFFKGQVLAAVVVQKRPGAGKVSKAKRAKKLRAQQSERARESAKKVRQRRR